MTVPLLFLHHVHNFAADCGDNGALLGALKATAREFLSKTTDGQPRARHAIAVALAAIEAAEAGAVHVQVSPFYVDVADVDGNYVTVCAFRHGPSLAPADPWRSSFTVPVENPTRDRVLDYMRAVLTPLNQAIATGDRYALYEDERMVLQADHAISLLADLGFHGVVAAPKAYEAAWFDPLSKCWHVGWGGMSQPEGHPQFTRKAMPHEAAELEAAAEHQRNEFLSLEGM